jgi:hypothetical protein
VVFAIVTLKGRRTSFFLGDRSIRVNDPHDPDRDPEELAARYVDEVQPLIQYCYNCQPYEGGEIAVWVLGERTDLTEVFDGAGVPEETDLREALASQLRCMNCGTEGFDLGTEVGIRGQWEQELEERFRRARKMFGDRIEDFQAFLERTPTLGIAHELGELILRTVSAAKFPECKASGRFFRARLADGHCVFAPEDLDAPPDGKAPDARFNHAGQSVLYLASAEEVAIAEVMGERESALVWIQQFDLQPIWPILDLLVEGERISETEMLLLALLESDALAKPGGAAGSGWKPGYLLPRFVADCARNSGYAGLRYPSVRAAGYNFVLFDRKSVEQKLSKVDLPKVVTRRPPPDPFEPPTL